jgi:AcrR family transcriptional regulator
MHRDAPTEGLRQRKKRETRSALAWAAVRLAAERGFSAVRVEDIAAGAGVSPRTFNNYFSSKAEAIVARHVDRLHAVAAELRARPPTTALWATIGELVVSQLLGEAEDESPPHPQWIEGVKLMLAEPAVQAEFSSQSHRAEGDIAAAITDRLGAQSDALHARLVAAAVGAVIQVSIEQWLRDPRRKSLRQVIQSAFERMGRIADARPATNGALAPAPSR